MDTTAVELLQRLAEGIPTKVKVAGTVASVVLAMIGTAGIPDDVRTWFRWLKWARRGVPWWILIVFASGMMTVLWVPSKIWLWGIVSLGLALVGLIGPRSKGDPQSQPIHVDRRLQDEMNEQKDELGRCYQQLHGAAQQVRDKDRRISELQTQVKTLEQERSDERAELKARIHGEIAKCDDERQAHAGTRNALEQERETVRFLSNKLRYDIEPLHLEPLTPVALEVAHNDLTKIRTALFSAGEGALNLAGTFGHHMYAGDDKRNSIIAYYFAEYRMAPTRHLLDRLGEELALAKHQTEKRIDYREWLLHFYRAYNEIRRTIGQMAEFEGISLPDLDDYKKWRPVDGKFLQKVSDIGCMHELIEGVNKRHNYPVPLPDVPDPELMDSDGYLKTPPGSATP